MADTPLTPMAIARYYMARLASRVDEEHYQELCRTVAYAIDPAATAYRIVQDFGLTELACPETIAALGVLPRHTPPHDH